MTRGFDELTLTFYETKKLCDHDKDNWWHYSQACKSLDTDNNKYCFPTRRKCLCFIDIRDIKSTPLTLLKFVHFYAISCLQLVPTLKFYG